MRLIYNPTRKEKKCTIPKNNLILKHEVKKILKKK